MAITNSQKVGLEDLVNTAIIPGIKELGIDNPEDEMIAMQLIRKDLFDRM